MWSMENMYFWSILRKMKLFHSLSAHILPWQIPSRHSHLCFLRCDSETVYSDLCIYKYILYVYVCVCVCVCVYSAQGSIFYKIKYRVNKKIKKKNNPWFGPHLPVFISVTGSPNWIQHFRLFSKVIYNESWNPATIYFIPLPNRRSIC